MGKSLPDLKALDPKGLIEDSYAIKGISEPECRTIFLDWAISVPDGQTAADALPVLRAHYADRDPEHPMSRVLAEGASRAKAKPARRGGAGGRRG
ncbi:MAG: hypothetical protein AAF761_10215 [Pseudomonadota bacterium]